MWEYQNTKAENDKNRLGYISGARMKINEAKFRMTQRPKTLPKTIAITGHASTLQGKTFVFEDKNAMTMGNYIVTKSMLANRSLAKKPTQFFNPMTIEWRVKYKTGGVSKTKVLGTSKHTVYVTLNKPLKRFYKVYITPLHLAI